MNDEHFALKAPHTFDPYFYLLLLTPTFPNFVFGLGKLRNV